jgi:hypothetical protein
VGHKIPFQRTIFKNIALIYSINKETHFQILELYFMDNIYPNNMNKVEEGKLENFKNRSLL